MRLFSDWILYRGPFTTWINHSLKIRADRVAITIMVTALSRLLNISAETGSKPELLNCHSYLHLPFHLHEAI